ncbi:GH1 family beta-glucosidase [Egicoccus halophilus]|uniref:Beta-glucosidase n=1 Tax=Egicoccus halophilus TaxID=1670830 RepID=A0A8J3A8D0_9ACTN|nr:GH1 family beta-glucosidase [Egicoccus halophilus]GGI06747.1 beta-glucosidase [Egicoccus halophilus]
MTFDADRLPGLRFGVATSSYQIEGATDVDGRGDSIWDVFGRVPGAIADGDTGEPGCDHYHRLEEDLDLLAWLGVDAYRFSIAWPRVLPDGQRLEPRGLAFYDRLVDGLLARGITPLATLYHWDLPQALETAGGWAQRSIVDAFATYARIVTEHLGDRVRDWSTLNEPWCSAFLGYDVGVHAPGVRSPRRAVAATHHLLLAHGRGSRVMREVLGDGANIGIVLNPAPVRPASDAAEDHAAAALGDAIRNRVWTDPLFRGIYPDEVLAAWEPIADLPALHRDGDLEEIAAPVDLLGLNYYTPVYIGARSQGHDGGTPAGPGQDELVELPGPEPTSEMGWTIDASGLYDLLVRLHADYGVPMAITETGGAFPDVPDAEGRVDDHDRISYLDRHLEAFAQAAQDGVDLRAFYVWTLLDNFEWAEGYKRTFGIVRVDRDTLERTPKASAHWYRELLASRSGSAPR